MSRLTQVPMVDVQVSIQLNESEMRALDALAGYGADSFLKVFYEHMGKHYMRPHEAGLRSLFKTIQSELPPIMKRAEAARTAFALRDPVIRSRVDHDALVERIKDQAREKPAP